MKSPIKKYNIYKWLMMWSNDKLLNFMCYLKIDLKIHHIIECNKEIMKLLKDWIGLIQMANDFFELQCGIKWKKISVEWIWNAMGQSSTLTWKNLYVCVFILFFSHNFQCNVRRKCALTTSVFSLHRRETKKNDEWRKISKKCL